MAVLMRCFPCLSRLLGSGPVSCFNQMYSSQGISRIVNIKLIPKCVTKEYKRRTRNNLGSFLHENSLKWLLDLLYCQLLFKYMAYLVSHYICTYPTQPTSLYFVKRIPPLKLSFFVCLPSSWSSQDSNEADQHLTGTNWFCWLQLFVHASVAEKCSSIGYHWHPQQIVAAFIIPIKADPDLATDHPIKGCQYPTNNC